MADKKISALTAASSTATTDLFVVVQGSATNKIDIDTFFNTIPRRIVITETSEAPASGALSLTKLVSKVTPAGSPTAYTLAAGTHGNEKYIVCETFTSGTAVVTVTSGKHLSTITFSTGVGGACHLKNVDGYWYVVGLSATYVAIA